MRKTLSGYAINIFANVAVVGIGLALYERRWECLFIAALAGILGGFIAWRCDND